MSVNVNCCASQIPLLPIPYTKKGPSGSTEKHGRLSSKKFQSLRKIKMSKVVAMISRKKTTPSTLKKKKKKKKQNS
jgi:hypothetical protein